MERISASSERSEPSADVRDWDEQLEAEEIEYIIPLEITLPSERIGQLEDITAEIQSFDYDVLSSHELGIEAVLVIDGLQLGSSAGHTIASFGKEEEESETASEGGAHDKDGEARNAKDVPEAPFGLRPQPLEQHGHASGEDVAPKEQSDGVENDDLHEQEGKAEEAADGDSAGSASEPVVERKEDREQLTDKRGDMKERCRTTKLKSIFAKKKKKTIHLMPFAQRVVARITRRPFPGCWKYVRRGRCTRNQRDCRDCRGIG